MGFSKTFVDIFQQGCCSALQRLQLPCQAEEGESKRDKKPVFTASFVYTPRIFEKLCCYTALAAAAAPRRNDSS